MGRELRRVPLDFAAPLNRTWHGFINPHHKPCPEAEKTCFQGQSVAGRWFDAVVRFLTILGSQGVENRPGHGAAEAKRGRLFPHPYLTEFPQAPTVHGRVVEPDAGVGRMIAALAGFKKEWGPGIFGSDHDVQAAFHKRFTKLMALPEGWDTCPVCKGEGIHPEARAVYEAWKETPPPTGPGFQVWETVSEGRPHSPVFATSDQLVFWLTTQGGYSRAAAEGFVKAEWAPSAMIRGDGKFLEDIESCAPPEGK